MESKLLKSLNLVIGSGIRIKDIEVAIGMPKNNLSGILKGSKDLPKKYIPKLEDYLKNNSKKKVILIEDADGKFLIEKDGVMKRVSLVWENETKSEKRNNANGTIAAKNESEKKALDLNPANKDYQDNIRKEIEAIKSEKLPSHISTPLGKRSFEFDRQKRILELEKQLL